MPVCGSFGEFFSFSTAVLVGLTMVIGVSALNSAPFFMQNYYQYIGGAPDVIPINPKFWQTVLTFYSVVTMVTQTIFGPINLTTFCCRLSLLFRLTVSGILMLVELLVVLILPVSGHVSEKAAMAALMIMAFVGGFGRAFYENTGYALFGPFPSINISALMMGVSVCGVLMSIIQIAIKASMSDDFESVKIQSYIYFGIAIGIIVLTGVALFVLSGFEYACSYVAEFRSPHGFFANIYRKRRNDKSASSEPVDADGVAVITGREKEEMRSAQAGNDGKEDRVVAVGDEDLTTAELLQQVKLLPIIKEIYPLQCACCLNYFITYLLYPGVMLAVDYDDPWFGTIVMAVFNAGDLVGRAACLVKRLWIPRRWVVVGSVARLICLPLLLLCATGHIPSHAAAHVLTAFTAFTSGYLGTMSMTYAPESKGLNTPAERALAGQAQGVALLFGISVGSLLQLPIVLKL